MVGKRSYSALTSVASILWLTSCSTAKGNQTTCPIPDASDNLHYDGVVNATGTIPFKFAGEYQTKKDWYLSLTYNATYPAKQWRFSFISVPDDAGELRGCFHMFDGQNKTSKGSPGIASESCNGVLEEKCISALRTAAAPSPGSLSCRGFLTEVQAACGEDFSSQGSTSGPFLWSNETCRDPTPPGIDLPDGYTTTTLGGEGVGDGFGGDDAGDRNLDVYDLRMKQSFPFIITGFSGFQDGSSPFSDTQVICLSPSEIKPGSRVPPSAGMRIDSKRAGSIALVAASLAGLALVVM